MHINLFFAPIMHSRILALFIGLIATFSIAGPSFALAACTGSGTSWTCTAGTTIAQVNTALSSASDGATLTFAAGSYNWGSTLQFSASKGATLICASQGACTVNMSGPLWQWVNWGVTDKLYRISGFIFNNVEPYFIWLYGSGSNPTTITKLRIDHNTFNASTQKSDIIAFGQVSGQNVTVFGVFDHNVFKTLSGHSRWIVQYFQQGPGTWPERRIGTANNLFFEDNVFDEQSQGDQGLGTIDGDGGPHSLVLRYNTFKNARVLQHGYYWSFPGPSSPDYARR